MFESVEEAYPAWIMEALTAQAPTTVGAPTTQHWAKGLCQNVKEAVAQPMLPLYLCFTGVVEIDTIADAVDAMLVDTADGYPKPANIFSDRQVDDYLKACLVLKVLSRVPAHLETVQGWVDDYFSGRWIALFKDSGSLGSQNEWFQAAVGPNTMKIKWVREGLDAVRDIKGWATEGAPKQAE